MAMRCCHVTQYDLHNLHLHGFVQHFDVPLCLQRRLLRRRDGVRGYVGQVQDCTLSKDRSPYSR